ncbi:hypothetical protein SAMN05428988_2023 [Chitinophaga sp. YR573]|uniref:hypothetical protein n=1 Tax=Chitinophaga sp. YR573 TaxID=1881040 RepID=UPI0008BBD518|nr:hypothetical protein [Chitinophaga sp. YR573]SEW09899.1 hypothetical protein SAMN05428988_2023 [Chitinophaga sp. YR573]
MTNKIVKTPVQVATQLARQYLMFYNKKEDTDNLFNLFSYAEHGQILNKVHLAPFEIPVLILTTCDDNYIVNTTTRFIRISPSSYESVYYSDFKGHFRIMLLQTFKKDVKLAGWFGEAALEKINGELIYWDIPIGIAGGGFQNITRRCSIIGRRISIIP